MVLLLFFFIILFYFVNKDKTIPGFYFIITLMVPLFLFIFWSIEYSTGSLDFFISDESYYIARGVAGDFSVFDARFLWYMVNYWIINCDIFADGIPLKLINIPLYSGFIVLLYKIFDNNKNIFLLPLILPYTAFCALFNLRDIAILFFIALSVYLNKRFNLLGLLSFIPVYLLRPFWAVLIAVIFIILELKKVFKSFSRGFLRKSAIIMIIILLLFGQLIYSQIDHIYNRILYSFETGGHQIEEMEDAGYATDNRVKDVFVSSIRYAVAPMPHSLLSRILEGGSESWGLVDDIIRFLNQVGFYLMGLYLLLNYKNVYMVAKSLSGIKVIILVSLFMYWPVYSFHLYGATHQRTKIPLQIAVFIITILTIKYKRTILNKKDFVGELLKGR